MIPSIWKMMTVLDRNLILKTAPLLTVPILTQSGYFLNSASHHHGYPFTDGYIPPLVTPSNDIYGLTEGQYETATTNGNNFDDCCSSQKIETAPQTKKATEKQLSVRASQFLIENLLQATSSKPMNCHHAPSIASAGMPPSVRVNSRKSSPRSDQKRLKEAIKRYACSTCDKRFTKLCNLTSHTRTHTDERPFACSFCAKNFRRKDHLKDHEFIHSSKKPFECALCSKGFCQYRAHDNHIIRHHPNSPAAAKILRRRKKSSS